MTSCQPFGDFDDDVFVDALLSTSREELLHLLERKINERTFVLFISFIHLSDMYPEVAYRLFRHPRATLGALNLAAVSAQHRLLSEMGSESCTATVKECIRVRVQDLFYTIDAKHSGRNCRIADLLCEHVGCLLCFECTVVRTGLRKVIQSHPTWKKCELIQAKDEDKENEIPERGSNNWCVHRDDKQMSMVQEVSEQWMHSDYQEIEVQQCNEQTRIGELPRSITVILQDDLADSCQVGNNVEVSGIVSTRGFPKKKPAKATAEFIIIANNIQSLQDKKIEESAPIEEFQNFWKNHESTPLAARTILVSAICPQLFGHLRTKFALLLMLIGGCQAPIQTSLRKDSGTRSNVHLLLIGDPGTGKSQLMKFASVVSPRCVMANGKGVSSAGLTVAAIKKEGNWTLEAGALVMADGGICCIDEFNGIPEMDRGVLHEVMEQQTLSVAKAGIVTTLRTRTSVLASMNPIRSFRDNRDSFAENSGLTWPLISRFDLVFIVHDNRSVESDASLADHILGLHQQKQPQNNSNNKTQGWTVMKLRQYIDWVKHHFTPTMTEEAINILKKYYQYLRQRELRTFPKITIRALESLIRISQAHAKMMARNRVLLVDAVSSILLFESSAASTFNPETILESLFESSSPDQDHISIQRGLFKSMHFDFMISFI